MELRLPKAKGLSGAMKRALKIAGLVMAILVVAAGSFCTYVAIRGIPSYRILQIKFQVKSTPQSVARGRKLVGLLCVSCHLDSATGALTGKHMEDVPAQFGSIYAPNITQDKNYGVGS